MTVKVHVFKPRTNLRRGGIVSGPNNVIKVIGVGQYEALYQCVGERVTEGNDTNVWWVKIVAGSDHGWVSAVRISVGGDNDPIPGVETRPTAFV